MTHTYATAGTQHVQAGATRQLQAVMGDSVRPIFDAGLVDLVEMDHRISPEMRLSPTSSHTPGHVSVEDRIGRAERGNHRRHSPPSLSNGAS